MPTLGQFVHLLASVLQDAEVNLPFTIFVCTLTKQASELSVGNACNNTPRGGYLKGWTENKIQNQMTRRNEAFLKADRQN